MANLMREKEHCIILMCISTFAQRRLSSLYGFIDHLALFFWKCTHPLPVVALGSSSFSFKIRISWQILNSNSLSIKKNKYVVNIFYVNIFYETKCLSFVLRASSLLYFLFEATLNFPNMYLIVTTLFRKSIYSLMMWNTTFIK